MARKISESVMVDFADHTDCLGGRRHHEGFDWVEKGDARIRTYKYSRWVVEMRMAIVEYRYAQAIERLWNALVTVAWGSPERFG